MMYRWLPVGHNWTKCNLYTDKCPCCGCPDETFEHLLLCPHEALAAVRRTAYLAIQRDCRKIQIPLNFMTLFLKAIQIVLDHALPKFAYKCDKAIGAMESQQTIGMYHMIVGFLSDKWTDLLVHYNVDSPEAKIETLLNMLWNHICEPIWATHNNIKHSRDNASSLDISSKLRDELL